MSKQMYLVSVEAPTTWTSLYVLYRSWVEIKNVYCSYEELVILLANTGWVVVLKLVSSSFIGNKIEV